MDNIGLNSLDYRKICKICGLRLNFFPWGETGTDPTWGFCPCCGCEFGYQDFTPEAARINRVRWLSKPVWDDETQKPKDWNVEEQLKQIDPKYR